MLVYQRVMPYFHRCFIDVLIWHLQNQARPACFGHRLAKRCGKSLHLRSTARSVLIPVLYGSGRWCKCLSCLPVYRCLYIVLPCVIGLLVVLNDLNWMLLECSKHFCKIMITESEEISRIANSAPHPASLCATMSPSASFRWGVILPMYILPCYQSSTDAKHPHTARICRGATVIRVASVFFFGHQYVELA